jgi:histidinol-phosphate aminotransferase
MGLLDYYRQFEGMSQEEINEGLREEAAERRRKALTQVDALDLSQTAWPALPDPRIVNAITYVARRGLHRYPPRSGIELREALGERHGVDPARVVIGNGSAELLGAAARALIEPGQRLLTRWPSYPLFPIMARRAQGRAVAVTGGVEELLAEARGEGTRVIALASPNDPTGELLAGGTLERLLGELPDNVAVLLDESLVEFADAQPTDSSIALLESHSRLLVFRSFSKAWGLAGLRVGYVIGGPGAEELLGELEPDLGLSEISEAGVLEALRSCSDDLVLRVRGVGEERVRLTAALRARGFEVAESQANFVWAAHPALAGDELAGRLARAGVLVASGAALDEPRHVRIAVQSPSASARLLDALAGVL